MIFEKKQESFSKRLRRVMEEQNMRQVELCAKTGIGKSAMSQYLGGAFLPKPESVRAIAKALDVSEGWLMGYDVSRKRTELAQDPGVMEVIAVDDSMESAYMPKGAVVSIRRAACIDNIDNGSVVCFSKGEEEMYIRYYNRSGDVVVFTAAEPGYEPVIVSTASITDGDVVIHGIVEKVEIKMQNN